MIRETEEDETLKQQEKDALEIKPKAQKKDPFSSKKDPVKKISTNALSIFDENTERFGSPKIYQYSQMEKTKLCMDDDDFMKFIKRNYKSLKHRDNLDD